MAVEPKSAKQNNPAVITIGRFQPPTAGHVKVIEQMISEHPDKTPVVCIVKGKTSGKDKTKNPYEYDLQSELLKKGISKKILTIPMSSGFLGDIIDKVRDITKSEPEVLVVGKDREETFQKAIGRYHEIYDCDMKVMTIDRPDDDISATAVREAIANDDYDTFAAMTVNLEKDDFTNLRDMYFAVNK